MKLGASLGMYIQYRTEASIRRYKQIILIPAGLKSIRFLCANDNKFLTTFTNLVNLEVKG